ncbi:hypothetical protein Pmani_014315, partial [Petrolisthes manimaculis]
MRPVPKDGVVMGLKGT